MYKTRTTLYELTNLSCYLIQGTFNLKLPKLSGSLLRCGEMSLGNFFFYVFLVLRFK